MSPILRLIAVVTLFALALTACGNSGGSTTGASNTVEVTVNGSDVIYLAGRSDITIPPRDASPGDDFPIARCGGDLVETLPVVVAIQAGATFEFSASGRINFYGGDPQEGAGPDGVPEIQSAIAGLAGISAYAGPEGSLVGVFLTDASPAGQAEPAALDFSGGAATGFDRLAPGIGQVFYIGDGQTGAGSGKSQVFVAPAGATRLAVGIADASGFGGPPGCYQDNVGSYKVKITSSGTLGQPRR